MAEAALARSEGRYRSLVSATAQVVRSFDPEGLVTDASAEWEAFTGQSFEQSRGEGWRTAVHLRDRQKVCDAWERATRSREPFEIELKVRRPEGRFTQILARFAPVLGDGGAVREWVGAFSELSDRRYATEALEFLAKAGKALAASREIEATLHEVLELVVPRRADGCNIYFKRPDGAVDLVATRQSSKELEEKVRQLHQRNPASRDLPGGYFEVLRTGLPELVREISPAVYESRSEESFEILRDLSWRSSLTLPLLEDGKVIGAIAFLSSKDDEPFTDNDLATGLEFARRVSTALDNARLTEALRHNEERYRTLTGASFDALFIHEGGVILDANQTFFDMFGYPPEEIVGTNAIRYVVPEFADTVRRAIVEGKRKPYEVMVLRKSGETLRIEIRAGTIDFQGRQVRTAAVRDVSERHAFEKERQILLERERAARSDAETLVAKRTEELERTRNRLVQSEKLAVAGQLAGGMAHEINNPLAYIISNLAFVADELQQLAPEARGEMVDCIREASEGAERVRRIVSDLKTFSRPTHYNLLPLDVRAPLRFALQMAAKELKDRARLEEVLGEVPLVEGHESELSQVFLSLLHNAAQAISPGQLGANLVRIETALAPDGRVMIEFKDTGVGMAPEVQSRIFEPFFTTRAQGGGSGLGLSTCYGVIKSLGGEIQVVSELGVGSTFRVLLPAASGNGVALAPVGPSVDPVGIHSSSGIRA